MNRPDYYSYTATFSKDDDGWLVEFPDLERCDTNADTLDEAIIQANSILEDYMALLERNNLIIPEVTPYEKINAPIKQKIVVAMQNARLHWQNKTVKRTVTFPAWIEQKALKKGLNFSQVLQSALIRKFKETIK